jgi:predicted metalloprotease with PDZ domain
MRLRYTVSLARRREHVLGIAVDISGIEPAAGTTLRVAMPAWVPGHYVIMDNARNVRELRAFAGRRPLPVRQIDKQTWEIDRGDAPSVTVRHDLYAHTLSSAASWLGEDQCHLNGGSVFLYVVGRTTDAPCELVLTDRPREWKVATGLVPAGRDRWRAETYDVLVDSPLKAGVFHHRTFRVRGKLHHVVVTDFGHAPTFLDSLVRDTRRYVEWFASMFRGLPYRDYWFLYDLHPTRCSGGALEHLNSTHLSLPMRLDTKDPIERERVVVIGAHEYFHLWNVKRIRPVPLGPFDYSKEQHTTDLWVAEGLTDYYCYYALVRSGVFTPKQYFTWVGRYVDRLSDMPGRATQTVRESSFGSWTLGGYAARRSLEDADSTNRFVDYYTKGSLIGAAIDIEIRAATRGRRGLDDVFRRLMRRAERALEPGEFEHEVERVGGRAVRALLERYVGTTAPLALRRHFARAGLAVTFDKVEEEKLPPSVSGKVRRRILGTLGLELDDAHEMPRVVNVDPDSPAERAGLDKGDLLLAADDERLSKTDARRALLARPAGKAFTLTLFRHDRLLRKRIVPRMDPRTTARFTLASNPSAAARRVRDTWLGRGVKPFTTKPGS